MTEPENLVLAHLRRFDAKLDRIAEDVQETKHRVAALEIGIAGLRRDIAALAETDARLAVRMDRIDDRLMRIERRLDLVEPAGG